MLYANLKINRNRKGLIHKIERHQNLHDEEIYDKLDELAKGYNKIMKRFKEDMKHDEVMDGITMEKGEELADHLNSHINLVKDVLRKEKD